MEIIKCPRCRTTQSLRPNLKLLVNACGHAMCVDCVKYYFVRESGHCPECNQRLKKKDFYDPLLNEPKEEKKDAVPTDMYEIDNDNLPRFSTGIKCAPLQTAFRNISIDEDPLYVYEPPTTMVGTDGPTPPTMEEIESNGYLSHICPDTPVQQAGGYTGKLACMRAIQSAFSGLYTTKKVPSEKAQIPDIYKFTNLD